MFKNKKVLMSILLILLIILIPASSVNAAPTAGNVSINAISDYYVPSSALTDFSNLEVDDLFAVKVSVDIMSEVKGFDAIIKYDPTKLELTGDYSDVDPANWEIDCRDGATMLTQVVGTKIVDNINGVFRYGAAYGGLKTSATSKDIFIIQFKVKALGDTFIKFDNTSTDPEQGFTFGDVGANLFSPQSRQSLNSFVIGPAADTTAPSIELNGASIVNVVHGGTYTDEGVTITDNVDTTLVATVTYSKDGVAVTAIDTTTAGTYKIHYNVKDTAENEATEVTRTVIVAAPTVQSLTHVSTTLDSTNKIVTITFSHDLVNNTADLTALKGAISFASNGVDFNPLSTTGDTVAINGKDLVINFATVLQGSNNKIRIAANTLKGTTVSALLTPFTTDSINTFDECFIATAAFGSKNQTDVMLLRQFRDQFLLTNPIGNSLVQTYYHYSPPIAQTIAGNVLLKFITRVLLLPFVAIAYMLVHPVLLVGLLAALAFTLVQRRRSRLYRL